MTIHGRTAEQSIRGSPTGIWSRVSPSELTIPVLGSGDCIEPGQIVERMGRCPGVLVGRGVLRNPWILAQAADLAAGRIAARRDAARTRPVPARLHRTARQRAGRRSRRASGSRAGGGRLDVPLRPARGRERWVINKVRALMSWYSKGIDSGSYLRVRVNSASTLQELREIIEEFFLECVTAVPGVSGERLCG